MKSLPLLAFIVMARYFHCGLYHFLLYGHYGSQGLGDRNVKEEMEGVNDLSARLLPKA